MAAILARFMSPAGQDLDVGREFSRVYYENMDQTWKRTHWMGVKIQKLPLDLWTLQEIIFDTRPDFLVETGTRFGGSALFFAHLFDVLGNGRVLTIDVEPELIDPRALAHPRVSLLEGSSVDHDIVASVREATAGSRVMVTLDSDHTMDHVLRELDALAPLVTPGCYLVVEDTNLNGNPINPGFGPGPAEALAEWLPRNPDFEVDLKAERFMATFFPGGFLRRAGGEGGSPTAGELAWTERQDASAITVAGAVDESALLDRQRLALEEQLRDARQQVREADRRRKRADKRRKRAERKCRRAKQTRDKTKARLQAINASPSARALAAVRQPRLLPRRVLIAVSRRRR